MNIKKIRYILFLIWILFLFLLAEGVSYFYLRHNPALASRYLEGYERVIAENHALLRQPPDERGFTIFFYGASTMEGFPFNPVATPATWNEAIFQTLYPNFKVNAVNFGKGGRKSDYILQAIKQSIKYQPDLMVVLFGHNEFLRSSSIKDEFGQNLLFNSSFVRLAHAGIQAARESYQINRFRKEVLKDIKKQSKVEAKKKIEEKKKYEEKKDKPENFFYPLDFDWVVPGSPGMKAKLSELKQNLKAMIAVARENNVPIVIATPPFNMKVKPYGNNFVAKDRIALEKWEEHAQKGVSLFREKQYDQALEEFKQAEKIDNTNALLAFYMGESLERLGLFDRAVYYYNRANQYDLGKTRIIQKSEAIIRNTCRDNGVPYLNIHDIFIREVENGIVGFSLILDNAHPNLEGQYLLSVSLFRLIVENTSSIPKLTGMIPSFDQMVTKLSMSKEFEYIKYRQLGDYYLNHFDKSFSFYEKAYEAMPTKEIILRILALCKRFGKYEEAKPYIEKLSTIKDRGLDIKVPIS